VVLPLPRKPVTTVTGILRVCIGCSVCALLRGFFADTRCLQAGKRDEIRNRAPHPRDDDPFDFLAGIRADENAASPSRA
jgi:hypothetical protein